MCGIHLRTPATIDEFEASYRATLIICAKYNLAKDAIPFSARRQLQNAPPILRKMIGRLPFSNICQLSRCAFSGQQLLLIIKATIDNAIEVCIRNRTHC